ncbi:eukaryotic translation initiation factor 3 subunit G-domain-containing protein [Scheffersomyces coipomensis]|uniref:eukaryotic translation initiation factor 3 subunit G-domain-containing protein n=1 Tax=Scheffersomyces coipomensis TaxID=1788519 RepID=UPI00315C8052
MSSTIIGSWADAGDEFSAPDITTNPDGTKTVITFRTNQDGKKVKVTQRIREVTVQERVHPLIAQRKSWNKYGKEKNSAPGPDTSTTQLGEKVELKLGLSWKQAEKEEEENKAQTSDKIVVQKIACRYCGGDHYTSKCPYKETLGGAAASETAASETSAASETVNGKYVPRHLRADANGNISKESRDDATTLKVSQLNNFVDEDMLRNELFARFGPLQRVTIVRNRDTGESRGFAYVSFFSEELAEKALNALNGKGYHSLILHLEWSKKKKTTP